MSNKEMAPAVRQHPEARPPGNEVLMAESSVSRSLDFGNRERLLYLVYLPPHVYEDDAHDGQAIVTALFEEPAVGSSKGYAIREYSLNKGEIFYRFPKDGSHWSRAVIRQEWYRETETALPDSIFEASRANQGGPQ